MFFSLDIFRSYRNFSMVAKILFRPKTQFDEKHILNIWVISDIQNNENSLQKSCYKIQRQHGICHYKKYPNVFHASSRPITG